MNPLTTFVRSLGNDGALASAQAGLEAQTREDWLVQGLARRLDPSDPSTVAAPAETVISAVA